MFPIKFLKVFSFKNISLLYFSIILSLYDLQNIKKLMIK